MATLEFRDGYHTLVRKDIVPMVPKTGGALLDVGGGIGATAAYLKELGHVEKAGVVDLYAENSSDFELDFRMAGDLEDPALLGRVIAEQGPFNVILCLDILEHLVDPWALIAQLHKGLVPGGIIVASIPNIRYYKASLPLIFRNEWTLTDAGILDRTHVRFFVKSTAIDLMTGSGLTLDDIQPNFPFWDRNVRWFRKATFGLLNSFTDVQYRIRVRN